jgi:hypothetical protein
MLVFLIERYNIFVFIYLFIGGNMMQNYLESALKPFITGFKSLFLTLSLIFLTNSPEKTREMKIP